MSIKSGDVCKPYDSSKPAPEALFVDDPAVLVEAIGDHRATLVKLETLLQYAGAYCLCLFAFVCVGAFVCC